MAKFRNKKNGKVYDVRQGRDCESSGFCLGLDCDECPIYEKTVDESCSEWIDGHSEEAARLMGYELVAESDSNAEKSALNKVIAIDFDGTLFKTRWPEIIAPNRAVIDAALEEQRNGASLVLWTCREGELLDAALVACAKEGLHFDAVNDSTKEWKAVYGTSPRKIGATEYWDDKAVNPTAWDRMEPAVTRASILEAARRCVCGDREQDYGSPETSFRAITELWKPYLAAKCVSPGADVELLPEDVAAMMVLFKMARVATGHGKADNWIDAAGYAACGGEIEGGNQ